MKEALRASLLVCAALAAGSCAWLEGDRGGEETDASELPVMRRIPPWVRPPAGELARSAELRAAVTALEQGEFMAGAVQLQRLRAAPGAQPGAGAETAALHAWSLGEAGSLAEAEQVARAGLREFGQDPPALHYALASACERSGKPEPAYQSYLRVLAAQPADPELLRACGRTALAARQPAAAVTFFDRLALLGPLDLESDLMRAAALAGAGETDQALAVYEALARAHPQDPPLLAQSATAAFELARQSGLADHRRRAGLLLDQLTELDPQYADAFRMLGINRAAAGDLAGAEQALRRALELVPAHLEAGLLLAQVLADRNQRDAARRVLQELLRQPLSGDEVDAVRRQMLELGEK